MAAAATTAATAAVAAAAAAAVYRGCGQLRGAEIAQPTKSEISLVFVFYHYIQIVAYLFINGQH